MKSEKYFKLFTNCIVTKGVNRSLILDSQRNNFITIPDTMDQIINDFKAKKSINEVYNIYDEEEIINEYINFLVKNEYGFITDSKEFDLFPDLQTNFEIAAHITNCIVELSIANISKIKEIISGLKKLYCKNIQFISYQEINIEHLKNILISSDKSNFRSIELVLKYSKELSNFIPEIDKYNFSVTELILHSNLKQNDEVKKNSFNISYLDYELKNFSHCGLVDKKYFTYINKYKVLESLNHNTCLNRKISIDKDGNIKNCPSMSQSFGNIKDTTLEEALNHPDFKKYWNINKDQIEVCKDCEFRHICTDCRAYTERSHFDGEIDLSKPLKCGYNPYTNEWAEWSTNPLKQKAIEYYGMQELIKRKDT